MNNSFQKDLKIKNILKFLLFLSITIFILYLNYFKIISKKFTTILFIILGTIVLKRLLPIKTDPLFRTIDNDNLNIFKNYLSSHNLKVENIHTYERGGRTPIIYAIERRAYNIFKYLVENNYNLKYISEKSQPVITFVAHSGELKYMELLLQNKDRIDLYAINKMFRANALEISVWRGRDEMIEVLINAGMNFSINNYNNNTLIGKLSIPFEKVSLSTKASLIKTFVFNKTKKQLNMIYEINEQKSLKSFQNNKIYWKEYLDFA